MTWQRIDEDTYIDDTLVTCAEYQLFINEMRGQGKFYQPDHWTSYQFPEGKALEPVLGIRYLDALTFGEWLTKHEGKDWTYRIPASAEVEQFSKIRVHQTPLGYWTVGIDGVTDFTWIGSAPLNPRNIDINKIRLVLSVPRTHTIDRDFNPTIDRAIDRTFNRSLDNAINQIINHALALNINSELDKAITDAIIQDKQSNRAHNFYHEFDPTLALTRSPDRTRAIRNILGNALEEDLDPDRNIPRPLDPVHAVNIAFNNDPQFIRELSLLIDILSLQERIAGRSPAFEGIRLVKERIR